MQQVSIINTYYASGQAKFVAGTRHALTDETALLVTKGDAELVDAEPAQEELPAEVADESATENSTENSTESADGDPAQDSGKRRRRGNTQA